ncbi:MAG: pyridoxal 5'-phosphate synthase glutaminase subunit PdxT [Bacillota bacterium]|nr:pyridoxal 5'-phosphate synthase glutaminase subunit PdxT [Bacillota bacterium]
MRIGVLALQGAVAEHLHMLSELGCEAVAVKKPSQLDGLAGLIIPGGESTTIGKLMAEYGFDQRIRTLAAQGLAVYGTCAGLILLAKEIEGSAQPRLGLMDITAHRNAFGRQVESFEVDLPVPVLGDPPLRAVFIRAPYIVRVGSGVEVLARYGDKIVLARQGRFLASAFHPELTEDTRLHAYFLRLAVGKV